MSEETGQSPHSTSGQEPPRHERTSKDDRTWGMICHLAGPIGLVVTGGTIGWLAPLIIWLIKKDESAFIADQAKEALNFQITIFLAVVAAVLLTAITCGVGVIILIPVAIGTLLAEFIFGIIGGMRANEGTRYRYPLTLRLL